MLILVLLPLIYLGQTLEHCEVKKEQIQLFFSTQETFEWNLKDVFTGSYLNYTLSAKQPFFTLKKPIHQEYTPKMLMEGISKIVAIQAKTEQGQRVWLNQFAFIEKSINKLTIFYAEGAQGDFKPPNFNYKIVITQNQDIQCLSLEYLNNTSFLADCYNSIKNPIQNYFYVIDKSGGVKNISNQNYDVQNIITKRITKVIPFVDSKKKSIQLLFRSTPAYATGSDIKVNSQIEIYNTESLQLINQITARDIGTLLKVDDPYKYKFSLIDFELFPDGKLYILTAFDGIIILQMDQNLGFTLIDWIKLYNDVREFDVGHFISQDGSLVEVIGVLFSNKAEIYENRIYKDSYQMDFTPVYTTLLKISQELLIIQNKGKTYLINIQNQDLIYKEVLEGIQGILINQYMEELIYITQIDARRFTLSSGKLRFTSGDLTASREVITISALDELGFECKALINYKVLSQFDSQLYPLEELNISNVFHDYPLWTPFKVPVSGPNIQFGNSSVSMSEYGGTNTVKLQIKSGGTINVESIYSQIPSAKSSQFVKLVSLDQNEQKIAILFQESSTKNLLTYICSTDQYYDGKVNLYCINYMKLPLKIDLSNSNFQCHFKEEILYVFVIENSYTVVMYSISQKDIQSQYKFQYNSFPSVPIDFISVVANRLYVILNNQQLDIWNIETKSNYSITQKTLNSLGFQGNWKVMKVVGNAKYHPTILFIINNDNIIIADYHKELTIIKVLSYDKSTIDVAIGEDSFFVVVHTNLYTQIIEYDFSNYCNIFKMKDLPTYRYKIQESLTMTSSVDSGLSYIAAYDIDNNNSSVILIYKPMQSQRDSLTKVLIPKKKSTYISNTQLAVAGFNHYIFYLNDGENHNMEWIDKYHYYQVAPNYETNQWMNKFRLNLTISNLKQNPSVELSQAIVLYQTKSQIKFFQSNWNITNQKWIKDENPINMVGTIIDYLIQCQQCGQGKQINIIQPLSLFKYEFGDDLNVVDQIELGGNQTIRILLVSKSNLQAVRIYNTTNSFFKSIVISTANDYKCEKVVKFWNHLLVACRNSTNYQMATIWCDNESTCGNVIKYTDLTTSLRYIYQMNFDYKYLVIVDAHPKNLKSMDTFLRLFEVTFDDTKHTATYSYTKYVNTVQQYGEYLVQALQNHPPSYSSKTYILALMSNGNLRIFNASLTYKWKIDIYQEILSGGGEIVQNEFNDQFFIVAPSYSTYISTINILFTSQSLNYKFNLVYDSDNYKVKSFTYNYALSRYYDAQTLPGIWIDQQNKIASIPYRVQDKKVILFYELPDNSVNDKRIVYSQGGISEYHDFTYSDQVTCTTQKNVVILGVSSKYESEMFFIKHYNLKLKYTLVVDNSGGNLQNQIGSLELSNTISTEQLQFTLKIQETQQIEENSKIDLNETDINNQNDYQYI